MKVFITGVSSEVGRGLSEDLVQRDHEVIGFDLSRSASVATGTQFVRGDVRDFASMTEASQGCDTGVHLAAVAGGSSPTDILGVNVSGAYAFMIAAKTNRFRNAIVASSAPVHLPPHDEDNGLLLRTSEDDDHVYDLSKALQEVIARDFHEHRTPAMCLRFGHIVRGEREVDLEGSTPLADLDYCRGGWVALEDVVAACAKALEIAPRVDSFEVLNVVGARKSRERFNIQAVEERLGFRFGYDFAEYE